MRFVLLFLAGSVALYAGPIATVSCTLGTMTQTMTSPTLAYCSLLYPVTGDLTVGADAIVGNLSAEADTGISPDIPPSANASTYAYANDTEYFRSVGPARLGTVEYVIGGGGVGGSAMISDGEHQYFYACDEPACETQVPPPPLDFELGANFEVSVTATGGSCNIDCHGASIAVSSLQLFEADGTTPVNYFPVTVPEPIAGSLLLLAIPAAIWKFRRVVENR